MQREQEQRETLAQTIRNLGSEASQSNLALDRLQTRHDDISRQLSLCQSQERAARAAARTAESSAKALREELVRLKATVLQIRTGCANDVRKREVQIQRLKSHLTTQQRGNKVGLVGAATTISPGVSAMSNGGNPIRDDDGPAIDDPEYSLRHETTEFLTELSQGLSDENDNLIGLVRAALATLKEIQGLPENAQRARNVENLESVGEESTDSIVTAPPTSYDALSTDMDNVLDNLRTILTNPNFVPIEEVAVREEEIQKLRVGWDKMELKWREAITMMDGWRRRMSSGGDTVNLDEIKQGLGLGRDLNLHDPALTFDDDDDDDDNDTSGGIDEISEMQTEGDLSMAQSEAEPAFATDLDRHRFPKPLVEGHGNIRSPRKVAFKAEVRREQENNGHGVDARLQRKVHPHDPDLIARRLAAATPIDTHWDRWINGLQNLKRSSSASPQPGERSPKLTVQEKLNVAQAEAEAAAVAAGLKLDEVGDGLRDEPKQVRDVEVTRNSRKTRIKVTGRPRRRKSTLTPDELERLLLVS